MRQKATAVRTKGMFTEFQPKANLICGIPTGSCVPVKHLTKMTVNISMSDNVFFVSSAERS
jgi:hypothetical protein